jgi:hypothetical protein
MPDKEAFQKEIRANLKQWGRIIDELRAGGEEKVMSDRLISDSKDFIAYCNKGNMLLNKYLEAKRKLEELANLENEKWEKQALDIKNTIKQLDQLLAELLSIQ